KLAKPFHNEAIERKVVSILRSGMLVQGQMVKEFETKLSEYIGCKHAIAVNSGTAALQLGIATVKEAMHLPENKTPEVITTPLSFAATANAALWSNCLPVFADIDPETFNIDPAEVKDKINENTVAIEPVDVYGLPADLDSLHRAIGKNNILVVEDAAEAIGARYNGKKIGNISEISCFSTYATKNLHTCEGGFVTTNDDAIAEDIRMRRNQGQSSRYNHKTIGFNFRMQEINAAIGNEQLKVLDELNAKRRTNALEIKEALGKIDSIGFQRVDDPVSHSWYLFSLTLDERKAGMSRDKFVMRLKDQGIEADVAWPTPIHLQPYYRQTFGFNEGSFPISEKVCKTVFQLPDHPFLTEEEVQRTVATVEETLRK
ncbi:MAG: DegT/DnrJ/EryC1/StrS family aminotransferase, partial [Nitrososphaerales archaeon]